MTADSCPYFHSSTCRSCDLLSLPYQEQLNQKQQDISSLVAKNLGIENIVKHFISSERTFGSRNKAKMVVGGSTRKPKLGILNADFQVQDISACPLHIDPIPEILAHVTELVSTQGLIPYSVTERKGELKYIIVRASEQTGEILLRFVLRSENQINEIGACAEILQQRFSSLKVVSANIQPIHQAILEGEKEIILSKRGEIFERWGQFHFTLSPQSFSQVTSNVAEKLYTYAADQIRLAKVKTLLDVYCGIGAFSVFAHAYITKSTGVEISELAIRNAKLSAEQNNCSNLHFHCADAEEYLTHCNEKPDAILVNPPRRGLTPRIIGTIQRLEPSLLLYSSCNPETLVRDLVELKNTFKIREIQPFDMFPLTRHSETLAVLTKR